MPKLDISTAETTIGSGYPGRLREMVAGRLVSRLGDAGGLTQFGVNLVTLGPGDLSSLRHYHMEQDEFVMVTSGALVLVDDDGEHPMAPGDCATFPAGDTSGHHLVNRSQAPAAFLVVGTRTLTETAYYSDLDMMVRDDADGNTYFTRKDGSPLTADQIGDEND